MTSSMSGWRSLKRPSRGTSQREAMAGSTVTLSSRTSPTAAASRVASASWSKRGVRRAAKRLPGLGELHAAPGADEQLRAQPFLEIAHMAAHRGMGHEQLGGGLGEALEPGGGLEGLEGIQRWQTAAHLVTCKILLQAV